METQCFDPTAQCSLLDIFTLPTNVHQLFFIYGKVRCETAHCSEQHSQLTVIRLFSRDCAAYLPTVA